MSPAAHEHHVSVVDPDDASRALGQIADGCEACALDLIEAGDPAQRLVSLARASARPSSSACLTDSAIRSLLAFVLDGPEAVAAAAHVASCASCAARLADPALRESLRVESAALVDVARSRAARRVELAWRARRSGRRQRAAAVAIAAVAALLLLYVWGTSSRTRATLAPEFAHRSRDGGALPAGGLPPPHHAPLTAICDGDASAPCPVPGTRGRCAVGVWHCHDGRWGLCQQTVSPVEERCDNGADDDCDGDVDEGCSCLGDLTSLTGPDDESSHPIDTEVEFSWRPSSCTARPTRFRVRDLETNLIVEETVVQGESLRRRLSPPMYVAGHRYRWTVRVEAPNAPNQEYAAQFRRFSLTP